MLLYFQNGRESEIQDIIPMTDLSDKDKSEPTSGNFGDKFDQSLDAGQDFNNSRGEILTPRTDEAADAKHDNA